MKQRLLLLLLLLSSIYVSAQDFSNKGKEFWIAYPAHIDGTASAMGIYITSDVSASGEIKVGTTTIAFVVNANTVTRKFIGPNNSGDAPNTAVHLSQQDRGGHPVLTLDRRSEAGYRMVGPPSAADPRGSS